MSSLKNRQLQGKTKTVTLKDGETITFSIKPITQGQRIEWLKQYPQSEDPKSMDAINVGFLLYLHYIDSRSFEEEINLDNIKELNDDDIQDLSKAIQEEMPSKKE